ncbi:uncharacterized protein IUM83_12865 [Phytophthora cinnamomi]|uniref:uncharacterized protein n=1 Tax=Phytophthora cinnamomi TaxID=4785 RepID=UPI00355ACCE5|nr:hypothetical protein IUM83_12865 [Phytophthora cinnamomi]
MFSALARGGAAGSRPSGSRAGSRPHAVSGSGSAASSPSSSESFPSPPSSPSSSSGASSAVGPAPAAPFSAPVIPPVGCPSAWLQQRYAPWPWALRKIRLRAVSTRDLRFEILPPRGGWIIPRTPARAAEALTFASGNSAFQRFVARHRVHLDHWAKAYWDSTHDLFVDGEAWKAWRKSRNSRCSHAGDHMASVLDLAVELFHDQLADVDLLLDPLILHFPPSRSTVGRWYPGLQHVSLQEALEDVDTREPWRRFFRTPLDASGHCTVTRTHPAYSLPRLEGKFVQQI